MIDSKTGAPSGTQTSNPQTSNTRTIATNSFWYGAETLSGFVLLFATTIPLARILGPEKLGYFNYITWLTAMSTNLGGLGIPSMSGKFMAEYLGRGEPGVVRAVFFASLRLQIVLSVFVTALCLAIVLIWGDPQYRLVSSLQVLAILPGMLIGLPALANMAGERMRANFPGSMASSGIYLAGVLLSLWLGWGLAGVASSFLVSRCADFALKMGPCLGWMRGLPAGSISRTLRREMRVFAQQQLVLLVLGLIVWDRSDVVLLKMLSTDIRQITFFTLSFNLSEKLLLVPRVFGAAISASLMAQYGRDRVRMSEMAAVSAKYMFLAGAPLLAGMALVSPSLMRIMYGQKYTAAVSVLAAGSLFAIFKAVIDPPDSMLRANNRQGPAVVSTLFCAVVNLGLDWLLIPAHGAMGAAIGNGVAQTLHVLFFWALCIWLFGVRVDFAGLGKIALATAAMAPPVLWCNHVLPPLQALVAGALSGAIVFPLVLRLTSFFQPDDRVRLESLQKMAPRRVRPAIGAIFDLLIPAV